MCIRYLGIHKITKIYSKIKSHHYHNVTDINKRVPSLLDGYFSISIARLPYTYYTRAMFTDICQPAVLKILEILRYPKPAKWVISKIWNIYASCEKGFENVFTSFYKYFPSVQFKFLHNKLIPKIWFLRCVYYSDASFKPKTLIS